MKAMAKTSVMILAMAITGLLVIAAAPAMAAPNYMGGAEMQIDPEFLMEHMELLQPSGEQEEYPVAPCEVVECEVPGEEGDLPGDEGLEPEDEGEVPGDDNPGFDDGSEEETPVQPLQPETPERSVTPETPQQPVTPQTPAVTSSKLPNTGSGLLILAAAGAVILAVAFAGRKIVFSRTR